MDDYEGFWFAGYNPGVEFENLDREGTGFGQGGWFNGGSFDFDYNDYVYPRYYDPRNFTEG